MFRHTLVLAILLWGGSLTASANSWADALFDGLSHDFGATPHGPLVSHTFTITNTTGQRVHIASVRVSCGCLTTSLTRNELAPGEEAALTVNMDTRRFRGVFAKSVYVLFDRPETAEARITVQANSREDLTLSPASFDFGTVPSGKEATAAVTLTVGDGNCKLVAAKSDSGYIDFQFKELSREGGTASFQLTARLQPNLPAGSWYSTVWVTTNNSSMPRVEIPVKVEVRAAKAPSP